MKYYIRVNLEVGEKEFTPTYYTGDLNGEDVSEDQSLSVHREEAKSFFSLRNLQEEVVPSLKQHLRHIGLDGYQIQVVGKSYNNQEVIKF